MIQQQKHSLHLHSLLVMKNPRCLYIGCPRPIADSNQNDYISSSNTLRW